MFRKGPRKYNPNALNEYLEQASRFNYPGQHIGDFRYDQRFGGHYRYPAYANTAIFPFILIVLGATFGVWALIDLGLDFYWGSFLSKIPTQVISVIFIIGGILKLRARRKAEHQD